MITIADISVDQFVALVKEQTQAPRFVGSVVELAEALDISRQTAINMLHSGKYNKAIHHLVGNTYKYDVNKILEISRLK